MRYRRRRYQRRTQRGTLLLLLILSAVFLVSCVAGANPLWVRGVFGLDVERYGTESCKASLPTEGELADELCDMVEVLTAGSVFLDTFRTPSQAVAAYRDEILNDMLRNHYARYTGTRLLSSDTHVGANISTLIPAEDFENTIYRYFGVTSVRHKSGEVFEYLKEARGYTAPLQAWQSQVAIAIDSLEETEHTYRMVFVVSNDVGHTQTYLATFARHVDGTLYFYSLEQ